MQVKSRNMHKLCLIMLALSLIGCSEKKKPIEDIKYVKTATLCKNTPGDNANIYSGIIKAEFEPQLSFRVSGKIIKRNVDIGQYVKKGQILAIIDPSEYKLNTDSSIANLASAKSNYLTQQQNLERYRQLLKDNFVSQASFDTQNSSYDSAKAKYQEAVNSLQNSKNQLSYTNLTAPGDGIIASINMDIGRVVNTGDIVATMAFSGPKELEIQLPETQVNSYKIGQSASIQIWSSSKLYHGIVRTINQSNDAATRTYTSRIAITDGDESIKYGMSGYAKLDSKTMPQGLYIPTSSIYAIQGKSYVWLLSKDSTVNKVPVTVATVDAVMSLITSTLKCGDNIVSAGVNLLHDGQKVKVYAE